MFTFVVGLLGLLLAGHVVVESASRIGARFGLAPAVIGLTIVAGGTSAPELAVVSQSIVEQDTALAVGSIIGSNIANILLVLGLAVSFGTIRVTSRIVRMDIPVMIGASLFFLILSLDGVLGRLDGLFLVAGVVSFVTWTLRSSSANDKAEGLAMGAKPTRGNPSKMSGVRFTLVVSRLVAGVVGLAIAARYVVNGAEEIAVFLGVPELIVGLTILALGTSAPEIVTTLIAALRGNRDLAVGNAVGSNIFNILLVLGSTSLFSSGGIPIADNAVRLDIPVLLAAAIACLPIVVWDYKLDRWEGIIFVLYYIAYLLFLTLDATGHEAKELFTSVLVLFVMPLTVLTAGVVISRQRQNTRRSPSMDDTAEIRCIRTCTRK